MAAGCNDVSVLSGPEHSSNNLPSIDVKVPGEIDRQMGSRRDLSTDFEIEVVGRHLPHAKVLKIEASWCEAQAPGRARGWRPHSKIPVSMAVSRSMRMHGSEW